MDEAKSAAALAILNRGTSLFADDDCSVEVGTHVRGVGSLTLTMSVSPSGKFSFMVTGWDTVEDYTREVSLFEAHGVLDFIQSSPGVRVFERGPWEAELLSLDS